VFLAVASQIIDLVWHLSPYQLATNPSALPPIYLELGVPCGGEAYDLLGVLVAVGRRQPLVRLLERPHTLNNDITREGSVRIMTIHHNTPQRARELESARSVRQPLVRLLKRPHALRDK
jgi:hypothetical protein